MPGRSIIAFFPYAGEPHPLDTHGILGGMNKGKFIDRTGNVFGNITCVKYLGHQVWECRCTCGALCSVKTKKLVEGKRRNCGVKCSAKNHGAYGRLVIRLKRLGWTPEAVEFAKVTQNHRCAICNEVTKVVPDHEHIDPPKPRELLCNHCNSGLGFFKDDPKLCELASSYLRKWGKT